MALPKLIQRVLGELRENDADSGTGLEVMGTHPKDFFGGLAGSCYQVHLRKPGYSAGAFPRAF